MKIYLIIVNSDEFSPCALRAFRHELHAKNVKRKLAREKKYEESDLFIQEINLED